MAPLMHTAPRAHTQQLLVGGAEAEADGEPHDGAPAGPCSGHAPPDRPSIAGEGLGEIRNSPGGGAGRPRRGGRGR